MAQRRKKSKVVAYLRVSTVDQDLEKNRVDTLTFANEKDFGKVEFVEEKVSGVKSWKERKIKNIIDDLGKEKILGVVLNNHAKAYKSYYKYYKGYYKEK